MALGTFLGLSAVAATIGLLSLAGWFLSAAALASLSATGAGMFNFFFPSIGVRLFAFIRTGARYGERLVTHDVTFRILAGLRVWFYRCLEPLAPACLARYRSGDMLNRFVEDIDTLDNIYLRVLSPTVVALAVAFMLMGFLACFDIGIAVTGFLFLMTAGISVSLVSGVRGDDTGKALSKCSARLRTRIVEGLQGLGELLVFGAHRRHTETIKRDTRALTAYQWRMNHMSAVAGAVVILLSGVSLTVILYIGVERVGSGKLGGASLALVVLAVLAAFEAVNPLPRAYQYLGRSREAGRRLRSIVESKPVVCFPEITLKKNRRFDLVFQNVSFHYPGHIQWAVRQIDLVVPAGQRTGILGETGCGKSTLINLIVRFWDPSEGRVLIGGRDARKLAETDLRRIITAMPQRAHIFGTTIRENLLLAKSDATEAQLRDALKASCLLPFVDALPDGMDTWVGESGKLLSGGEARRLAAAQCFLRNGSVWVLDEPTEGLDRSTEQQLLESILSKTAGKTLLLVTHRKLYLERMDAIVVLKDGRIAAQGTYEEMAPLIDR